MFIAVEDSGAGSFFPFPSTPNVSYVLLRLRQHLVAPGTYLTAEENIAATACFQGALVLETSEQAVERCGSCPELITFSR